MSNTVETPDFLFLAGHPVLDFLNTRPVLKGRTVEQLGSLEAFTRWLTRAGRIDGKAAADALRRWSEGPEGERLAERARAFRETLRTMTEGLVRGRGASTEAVAAINFVLAENDGSMRLERQGAKFRTRFAARSSSPISLLGSVAEAAADLLSNGNPGLVRRCGNPDCVLFFYDGTRNHRRQWCSMGSCGNLMKVRAFRRRHCKPRSASGS
jgi:predicted RNA-binding Zn ribbon-like protein